MTMPGDAQYAVQPYDMQADREQLTQSLTGSDEVDALVSTITLDDMPSIVNFGADAAQQISQASDLILKSMMRSPLQESDELMNTLARIMSRFDENDLKPETGKLSRLLGNPKKKLEQMLAKYRSLGDEVDSIYVQLRRYEAEIRKANEQLDGMFRANVEYYHTLVKYILAGEEGCREIEAYTAQRQAEMDRTGDPAISFELQSLKQCLSLLQQRVSDLRTAEIVAMQAVPMIKTMEYNNMNLVRKINSAFIITLPVFKQALAQAVMLKRQQIQSEAMAALDAKANELIARNAQKAQQLSGTSGTQPQGTALETARNTIVSGIDQTRSLQADARRQQEEDLRKLQRIREDFKSSRKNSFAELPPAGGNGIKS